MIAVALAHEAVPFRERAPAQLEFGLRGAVAPAEQLRAHPVERLERAFDVDVAELCGDRQCEPVELGLAPAGERAELEGVHSRPPFPSRGRVMHGCRRQIEHT